MWDKKCNYLSFVSHNKFRAALISVLFVLFSLNQITLGERWMSLRGMRNLKKSHKCEMWRGENRGVSSKNGKACTLCLKHNSRPLYLSEKYFTVRYDTITELTNATRINIMIITTNNLIQLETSLYFLFFHIGTKYVLYLFY